MDLHKIKNITPTAISCFVTPCTYKNPFLPPFIPKLSNKENKRINNELFRKILLEELFKLSINTR